MLKKVLLIVTAISLIAAGSALACSGNCKTSLEFSGNHSQSTSAFVDNAELDRKGNVVDGSQAAAGQSTKGSVKGKYGIGATGGIGISYANSTDTKKTASAKALAANISASGVLGHKTCATLKGSGEAATVAVKSFGNAEGAAGTSGKFSYKGQTGQGAIVGGGITAGCANVVTGKNSVTATAAHGTVVGVGKVSVGNLD